MVEINYPLKEEARLLGDRLGGRGRAENDSVNLAQIIEGVSYTIPDTFYPRWGGGISPRCREK